jgi:phosphosulfolactate synthase (CoM biosynthesis protein A)
LDKLRRPVHITFISNHILKLSMEETEKFINEMVDEGLIEESKYGKGYYVVKSI